MRENIATTIDSCGNDKFSRKLSARSATPKYL